MGPGRKQDKEPISDINVTPLVDVMLVLLIIFMVTASIGQKGLTVSLPRATAEESWRPPGEKVIIVTIDAGLRVSLDGKPLALGELESALSSRLAGRKDKTVLLESDESISYGSFVKVVSAVKAAGAERLGMLTEAPTR